MIDVFKNPELNYNSNLLGRSSSIVIAEHGYTRRPPAAAGDTAIRACDYKGGGSPTVQSYNLLSTTTTRTQYSRRVVN